MAWSCPLEREGRKQGEREEEERDEGKKEGKDRGRKEEGRLFIKYLQYSVM